METTKFYGAIVKPGRKTVFEPNKDRTNKLHISQATLGSSAQKNERVRLKCRRADEGKSDIFLCSLIAGTNESQVLDVIFDEYVELSVDGETEIHVTGYTIVFEDDESSYYSDSDMEEGQMRLLRNQPESDSSSSEYSSSYDDEDDVIEFMSESSDTSSWEEGESDGASDDDEEMDAETARALRIKSGPEERDYVIEEITDDGKPGSPTKKKKKKEEKKEEENNAKGKKKAKKNTSGTKRPAAEQLEPSSPKRKDKGTKKSTQNQSQSPSTPSSQATTPGKGKAQSKDQPSGSKTPKAQKDAGKKASQQDPTSSAQIQRFPSGLEIINTATGKAGGKLATNGKRVYCKYVGRLKKTGAVFDKTKNKPFCFRLGVGEVIQGWDIGIRGMRVGDKRRITVPPKLGYGDRRTGPIPKNSTLVFDVELVDVK